MAYQTGTLANLNDVIRTLRDFLIAQGWTIHVNYREPIWLNRTTDSRPGPPPYDVLHWRWGQRLAASKGAKYIAMQDFYLTSDISYGTHVSAFTNGPGVAAVIGTGAAADGIDEAYWTTVHPAWYRHYTLAGDGVTPVYGESTSGPNLFPSWIDDVTDPSRVMIMPLPQVTGQENGTWATGDNFWVNGYPNNDTELPAPFGTPGGAAIPMKYWLMADASGDNWIMVCLHDTIRGIPKTTYLCCGDLLKSGDWTGGEFLGASHSNTDAFTGTDVSTYGISGHEINRFGPPGSIMDDGGMTFTVRLPAVDSSPASWQGVGSGARRILSTAEMDLEEGAGPLGTKTTSVGYGDLRLRQSSLVNAAPGLPVHLLVQRDNGLLSLIGTVPNIFQAKTTGFSPGTDTLAGNGDPVVVFDSFSVKKAP